MPPTPLWKKLGYREAFRVQIINAPSDYHELIAGHPTPIDFEAQDQIDMIHLFTNTTEELEQGLLKYQNLIKQNGMIWVSWYKKASKKPTELTEDIIRDTALALNLVDVKVCRIDDDWSALKMVIPVKFRTK